MRISKAYAKHICSDKYVRDFMTSLEEAYEVVCNDIGEQRARIGYGRCIDRLLRDYFECYAAKMISLARYKELVGIIGSLIDKKDLGEKDEKSFAKPQDPCETSKNTEVRNFRVGGLITPKDLDELPVLSTPKTTFIAPEVVDLRDYCVATQNQEDRPWCAAYAACGFASNILWRKYDVPKVYDPELHYHYAKKVDDFPNVDGTTLVAVLQSLLYYKLFSSQHSEVKVIRTIEQVKYAIHKFGCCLVGLMVTKEWYACNSKKSTISGKNGTEFLGGHAVLACGYTRDGVIIQNSWGSDWGSYGFALITWDEFRREFLHGAVLDNCLYDMKMT